MYLNFNHLKKISRMHIVRIGIAALLLTLCGSAVYTFVVRPKIKPDKEDILRHTVRKGVFQMRVTATGELSAKRSVKIRAPKGMNAAGIWETTITDLVAEGTVVREGDYVATLDRTELANKMSNIQTEIEKIQTQFEQARIDTAIELRALRDELVNLDFAKKEKLLQLDQSRYEPQSVIQGAQLELERVERDQKQLGKKYELKQQQAVARMQEINALLRQNQRQLQILVQLSAEFSVYAPKAGMVIYARTWNGKREPGSRVSSWDPVVAELPDLTDMISKTYVNEVDISKVQPGQDVSIKVDAFPDRSYTGKVISVANIGEQIRGFDAKVFEVIVQVNESDSILRPAMTTGNEILVGAYPDKLFIPLEALQSDSVTYVFKEVDGKVVRQEVVTGLSNDNQIVIEQGLEENDVVLLGAPQDGPSLPFVPIAPELKAAIKKEQEEAAEQRRKEAAERRRSVEGMEAVQSGGDEDGGLIIIME